MSAIDRLLTLADAYAEAHADTWELGSKIAQAARKDLEAAITELLGAPVAYLKYPKKNPTEARLQFQSYLAASDKASGYVIEPLHTLRYNAEMPSTVRVDDPVIRLMPGEKQ